MGSLRRDAGQQRVDGANEQVCAVATRHAGERGRQSGQRMASQRIEDDGRQRYEHDVAHLGGCVREDARKYDNDRDQRGARVEHHAPNNRGQPSRSLGNADTQQGHEDGAQWRELNKVPDEVENDCSQALGIHEADDLDQAIIGAAFGADGARIKNGNFKVAQDAGENDHAGCKHRKQRHRVGQCIAEPLNDVQETRDSRFFIPGLLCHDDDSLPWATKRHSKRDSLPAVKLEMFQIFA